jgi:nitroreductase
VRQVLGMAWFMVIHDSAQAVADACSATVHMLLGVHRLQDGDRDTEIGEGGCWCPAFDILQLLSLLACL